MTATTPPIDINVPPRFGSNSPRNKTSNLTSALQEAGATGFPVPSQNVDNRSAFDQGRMSITTRDDSLSNVLDASYQGMGARPIMVKDRPRRESNNTGSFMGGMSWGGISVGSWVRDDVIMAGTSPNSFHRSPSFHSSSYLPKMEASFLRDYQCCGLQLDSLHELLHHYEQSHAQASSQIAHRPSVSGQSGQNVNRRPSNPIQPGPSRGFGQPFDVSQTSYPRNVSSQSSRNQAIDFSRTQLSTVQDMDSLEDMELDDTSAPSGLDSSQSLRQMDQLPGLNTNMQAQQAFRTSTPTTPSASHAFSLFSDPTVSSVNTPALSTQALYRSHNQASPESSIPNTPAALPPYDTSFDMFGGGMPDSFDFNNVGFGLPQDLGDLTIHEPAKRLSSRNGNSSLTPQQLQLAMTTGQIPRDSNLGNSQLSGLGGSKRALEPEPKKYRCPVIGCEKAYKNQNGLKYHKVHGHMNQKLQQNEDGSFSIVDPVTRVPYPGTKGMEKEKPYRCEVCGKRYKNLNGLKYHRQHTAACAELKPSLAVTTTAVQGLVGHQGFGQ